MGGVFHFVRNDERLKVMVNGRDLYPSKWVGLPVGKDD